MLATETTTITGYTIQVYNGQARLYDGTDGYVPLEPTLDIPVSTGSAVDWSELFQRYPGQYTAGSSQIYLQQPSGNFVIGTIAVNSLDTKLLQINYNPDTYPSNTGIDSQGYLSTDVTHYNAAVSRRPNSPGTFDAIINPQTYVPTGITAGKRYLIIEDIGSSINDSPSTVWGPLVAYANDIIEYTGTAWHVIFNSNQEHDTMIWQTNIYTGVQYLWNGVSWVKSFEGEYTAAQWKIIL